VSKERAVKRREGNEIEFSRIVAFSDGVFAIAITLLVLSLHVPEQLHGESLGSALWDQRQDLLAYAISFAVIGRFWVIHHRFFGDVTGFDGRLLALNILYLAWIVLIPFSSEVLGDHGGDTDAIVLYAVNLAAVALLGWVMAFDAHRSGLTTMARLSGWSSSSTPPGAWWGGLLPGRNREGDRAAGLRAAHRPAAVGNHRLTAIGSDRAAPARGPLRAGAARLLLPGRPDLGAGITATPALRRGGRVVGAVASQ
jgi:uncharacterized membrane protein